MKEVIVISLGGSVIVPNSIDTAFLSRFKRLISSFKRKYNFIIVCGGGSTARSYMGAAASLSKLNSVSLDWLGIQGTLLNAYLLKTIFDCKITYDPTKKVKFDSILIAGGWKPGVSTDYDMVLLAQSYKVKKIINLTNVSYLHDKDPNKYKSAKKILEIDWKGLRVIVGDKFISGMNVPFDPIAAKKAQSLGLELVLLGNDLRELENYLNGKKFKGSLVKS